MAFTVEDGTIVANANAYITVAEFKAYHDEVGNSYAALADDTAIEQAIVKATRYVERRWGNRFRGTIQDTDQVLSFPRLYLQDRYGRLLTGIPTVLKDAIAIYALASASGALEPEPTVQENGQTLKRVREKVGPIETETEYSDDASVDVTRLIPEADRLIQQLVFGVGGVVRA